jgi:hypothetical protein
MTEVGLTETSVTDTMERSLGACKRRDPRAARTPWTHEVATVTHHLRRVMAAGPAKVAGAPSNPGVQGLLGASKHDG